MFLPTWVPQKGIVQEEALPGRAGTGGGERSILPPECLLDSGKAGRSIGKKVAKASIHHPEKRSCPSGKRGGFVPQCRCRSPDIFFESHSNMLSYRLAAQGLGVAVIPEITLELMQGGMEAEVYHLSKDTHHLGGVGIVSGRRLHRAGGAGPAGDCEVCDAGT